MKRCQCVSTLGLVNIYQRTVRRISSWPAFRWLLSKFLTPLDLKLRNTRFAPSKLGVDFPLCYLTTTGRMSGEPRTVPLLYIAVANGYGVAATNFGTEHHPAWSYNLDAEPHAIVEIDGVATPVLARRASGEDADAIWHRLRDIWPAYDTYRDITDREVRVYELIAER